MTLLHQLSLKTSLFVAGLLLASSSFATATSVSAETEFSDSQAISGLKLGRDILSQKFDLAEGEALASTRCIACHGNVMLGIMPTYPSLMGQKSAYLFKQLIEFKQGKRTNPIMQAQAGMLSETEMKNVAYYYSQQAPLNLAK